MVFLKENQSIKRELFLRWEWLCPFVILLKLWDFICFALNSVL